LKQSRGHLSEKYGDNSADEILKDLEAYLIEEHLKNFKMTNVLYAGQIKNFKPEDYIDPKGLKRTDRYQQFAIVASALAQDDANLKNTLHDIYPAERIAVVSGSSMGGMESWEENYQGYLSKGVRGVSPFFIMKQPVDMAAGEVSRFHNAHGPIECPAAACATGALVVGRAFELIQRGAADIAFSAASEAPLTHLGVSGFEVAKAISTREYPSPASASRPFDIDRSGFIMSEGAACLIVENLELAKKRNARIYAEIIGFGNFADAFHPTQPNPDGHYAAIAMNYALKSGQLNPEDVDYINAHGTSTPLNDKIETKAIERVFGIHTKSVAVSSTKSMTGHLMGAAGTLEVAISALAIHNSFVPPSINCSNIDPECSQLNIAANTAQHKTINVAISNSFGFGGRDACVALRRV
jgi:3-oxoacyl-[acyl-carrier-protein] synthase II